MIQLTGTSLSVPADSAVVLKTAHIALALKELPVIPRFRDPLYICKAMSDFISTFFYTSAAETIFHIRRMILPALKCAGKWTKVVHFSQLAVKSLLKRRLFQAKLHVLLLNLLPVLYMCCFDTSYCLCPVHIMVRY